jgi:thioredoxin reductase (NADPH)
LRIDGQYRVITLSDGSEVSTRALLIASGVSYRTLDVPGAASLTGAGVYYGAALTEAISCRDEEVLIVGGGNSAGQAALFFAQYASHVTVVVRGAQLGDSMSQYLVDQVEATPNVTVLTRTRVTSMHGDERLRSVTLTCDSEQREMQVTSLFAFIGAEPRTEWVANVVQRDEHGFIRTGSDLEQENGRPRGWTLARDPFLLETNIPGVFCAGDVRHQSVKRVASAVGEGAIAVQFTHRFLAEG